MTGPIDARIKQYVDKRFDEATFGTDRIEFENTLLYLLRLLVEQRQMVLAERWYNRLVHLQDAMKLLPRVGPLPAVSSPEAFAAESANRRLLEENKRFIGAIRNDPDPTVVFEHWFAAMKKHFETVGLTQMIESDDQLPPLPSSLQDLLYPG